MPPVPAELVSFGRPATEALARAIRDLEGDDPLAPVTVVVPSNLAGLTARRLLAADVGRGSSTRRGLVNVSFPTPYRLAAQLGGETMAMAGRLPLTSPVLHAAVRAALRRHDGSFAPVSRHVATELAVARTHGELSRASPASLDALRASPSARTRDLMAIIDDTRARLHHYHHEEELVAAAIQVVADDPAAAQGLGSLVVHLVDDLSPAMRQLLGMLVEQLPARLVVGLTGDHEADAGTMSVARSLATDMTGAVELDLVSPATRLIEAADPDEEVRAVVRHLAAQIDRGRPLDRMAVLYPVSDPYLRTVHDQLDAAGIIHNGPTGRRLVDSVVGRLAVRLLDQVVMATEDPSRLLRRQGVIDIISAAPIHDAQGRPLPATAFDLLSRRAGVIGGLDDWHDKLERHHTNLTDRLAAEEESGASTGRLAALTRERTDAMALQGFVAHLGARLSPEQVPTPWRERSAWMVQLLADLLPPEDGRSRWPDSEVSAAESVVEVIEGVAVLDQFDPGAGFAAFSRSVQSELESTGRRRGRFGQGVLVAPLGAAVGLDVDCVYLLGANEGILPPVRREDSLLPDDERRRAVDGELALRRARTVTDRRDFLATLAIGSDQVVLVHGAGDHRTGKERLPSRWLLEVAGALVHGDHQPLLSSDWPDELNHVHPLHRHLTKTRSFREGVDRAAAPASLLDHDLARLVAYRDSALPLEGHHLFDTDEVLRRGLGLARDRRSSAFTRFDGNLASVVRPASTLDGLLSATRLETWAACPMRYFLANELGLGEVERPEEIIELGALDRGNLVHVILEDFLAPVVAAPVVQRPSPSDRWDDDDRRRP